MTTDLATPSEGLAKRAVHSMLWSALSFGSSRLVVFLVTLALARLLSPRDFGVVAAGLTLITLLEIALDLGLGATVVYEQEEGITHRVRTAFTLNLAIAVLLAGVAIAASPAIAGFFRVPQATGLLRVLFCYLVLRGAGQVQVAVLQRDLRYRARTAIDVTRAVARGAVSLALAATGSGPWAIVLGLLAGEVAGLLVASYLVRVRPTLRLEQAVVRTLLGFGVSVLALKVLGALLANGDALAIGNRLGPTDLGLYTVADRLPELAISSVFWILSDVAFSLYSKARSQGAEAFRDGMLRALRLVTFFGFSAGTGLAVLAPSAVPLLFSARWTTAVAPTVVLSLAVGLSSIGYASGDIFPAIGRPGAVLRLTAWVTCLSMVGYWLAAPYGITAVAFVLLGQQVVLGGFRLRLANRLVGSTWGQVARALVPAAASAAGIALFGVPALLLLPRTPIGLVLTLLAGLAGALVALLLAGRPVLHELLDLAGRRRPERNRKVRALTDDPRRLRVLLVGQAAPARGGIPSFLDALAADPELAARADVRLLNTTRTAERRAGTLTGGNLANALVDTWRTYRAARGRDVVHLQTALLPALPLLRALAVCAAGRLAGAAVVCHIHSAQLNTGRAEALAEVGRSRWLLRLLPRVTDRLVTVSVHGTAIMAELCPGVPVATVHNAVDVASFAQADPGAEPARIVYVGTLTRRKGLVDLAAALELLADRGLSPEVDVVGGSNEVGAAEAEEVRREATSGRARLHFSGSLPPEEVRLRLAGGSLFTLPSHEEGQPIAILEAMAAGLPVVVTAIGANPDVVRDGVDGLLVAPRDPSALADALERLLRDPVARRRLGAAARERAQDGFDRGVLRDRLLEEYAAAVRTHGRLPHVSEADPRILALDVPRPVHLTS